MFEPWMSRVERAADERARGRARLLAEELEEGLPEEIALAEELHEIRLRGRRLREALGWALAGRR